MTKSKNRKYLKLQLYDEKLTQLELKTKTILPDTNIYNKVNKINDSKEKKEILDNSKDKSNILTKNLSILDNNKLDINKLDNNLLLLPINNRRIINSEMKDYKIIDQKMLNVQTPVECWSKNVSKNHIESICENFKELGLIAKKRSSHVLYKTKNQKFLVLYDNKNKDLDEIESIRKEFNK